MFFAWLVTWNQMRSTSEEFAEERSMQICINNSSNSRMPFTRSHAIILSAECWETFRSCWWFCARARRTTYACMLYYFWSKLFYTYLAGACCCSCTQDYYNKTKNFVRMPRKHKMEVLDIIEYCLSNAAIEEWRNIMRNLYGKSNLLRACCNANTSTATTVC